MARDAECRATELEAQRQRMPQWADRDGRPNRGTGVGVGAKQAQGVRWRLFASGQ